MEIKQEYMDFMDALANCGIVPMSNCESYIIEEFGVTKEQAIIIKDYWIRMFLDENIDLDDIDGKLNESK